MSCTPTSNSLERSLSPLSPSDESRFVPHPSISSEDEHFKSSPSDDEKKKVDTDTKVQDNNTNMNKTTAVNNTDDAPKQPNLVAEEEDDEDGGIVGATICFTPDPSPSSSPNMGGIEGNNDATGALSKLDSLNSNSNDYIGSVQGAPSDRSNSRKSSSVVMHVASSLDGRSTTEYELLDALSSKGTIEVEELVLDEDDEDCDSPSLDEKKKKEEKSGGEVVSAMLASNPSSGATVASDAPFKNPDTTSNSQVPAFVVSTKPDDEAVKLDLNSEDVNEEKDMEEDTSTSSKVDSRPLTPFKSLHKFWQGQATKGMLGRILGTDISKDDTEEDAQTTPTPDEPLGTHVDELDGSSGYQQDDDANQTAAAIPKTQWLVNCLSTLFSSAVQYVVSCLVTAGLLIGVFVYGYISSILGKMKALVQRILHKRIKRRAIAQVSNDVVEKVLQDAVDKIVLNSEETDVVPPEHTATATNLSKLFTADEKLQEEKEISTALEPKEKALLQKINDKVTASIVTKGKEALLALKDNKVLSSIMSVALISVFLIGSLLQDGTGGSQETDDISIHLDANHSLFNLHCVMTHTTNYHDIPLWLMLLSPTSFEDEVATASRYWLFTFTVFSVLSSMFVAFKSKIPFPFNKPDILTGIWSEEEHQQFLAGYNVHGTKWKLVSAFVPTRTHNQVKAHGCYWMKIRSPARMTKSRKELTPVRTSFGSTLSAGLLSPRTPSSVCSTKSTPRKSNKKSKQAITPTPLKGILVEKSSNQQFDKNVTPRSAERKKRMQNRKMQGSKSDPVKRRVRIQAP